ncbi:MAG: hypothetical protein QM601_03195, partial [Pseudoxanthomonas sp.]
MARNYGRIALAAGVWVARACCCRAFFDLSCGGWQGHGSAAQAPFMPARHRSVAHRHERRLRGTAVSLPTTTRQVKKRS